MKQALAIGILSLALSMLACSTSGVAPSRPGSQPAPFVLQSNAPSPWQVENSITIPFVGPDGASIWTFLTIAGQTSALRLDIPTNVVQTFPVSGTVNGGHAGPDGNFWFCGTGQVGKITANGDITYYPEPLGGCQGMTTGPDGNLWIADPPFGSLTSTSFDRVTPDGQLTTFTIPAGVVYPATSAKDRLLWFEYATATEGGLGTFDPTTARYQLFPISPTIGGGALFTGLDGNAYFVTGDSRRPTGLIIRVTPQGKVTRFTNVPKQHGDPRPNTDENVGTVWYGGRDLHLYGWTIAGHKLKDEGTFPAFEFSINFTQVGPDDNVWFEGGVFLRRLLLVSPQSATLQVGAQQLFSINETDCPQCVWTAKSSNSSVASASAVVSGAFTVTAVSSGLATITVSDKRNNAVHVPITVP